MVAERSDDNLTTHIRISPLLVHVIALFSNSVTAVTMLAPRKKLWSTPSAAIDASQNLIELTSSDTLYDVGCGDGRVIIHLASNTPCRRFVGIEIDEDRAREAQAKVDQAKLSGQIPKGVSITIRRENALEVDYTEATAVFLYLVPRGLRLIKPYLVRKRGAQNEGRNGSSEGALTCSGIATDPNAAHPIRVVTYMAGFADERYIKKELCTVDHQEGAAWPIYLYHLRR
jgi:hypothetical protein